MHMCAHMCVRKYVHIGCMCACCVLCRKKLWGQRREQGGRRADMEEGEQGVGRKEGANGGRESRVKGREQGRRKENRVGGGSWEEDRQDGRRVQRRESGVEGGHNEEGDQSMRRVQGGGRSGWEERAGRRGWAWLAEAAAQWVLLLCFTPTPIPLSRTSLPLAPHLDPI